MTTMALTDPPLKRLFSRIDSLPHPRAANLGLLHEIWLGEKGDRLAAERTVFEGILSGDRLAGTRIFAGVEGLHDYRLYLGHETGDGFPAGLHRGERLSQAPDRRGAVRCRRVLDKVLQTGEPLLVEFTERHGTAGFSYELLAVPLLGPRGAIDTVAIAVARRPVAGGQARSSSPQQGHARTYLFAFARDASLAKPIALALGRELSPLEERAFEDGEHKARPLVDVSGRETVIITSLDGDDRGSVNDRLCRLLFFIGALKTNGAARVVAVIPYLCYQRKDRQTKPFDPLTSRYVAQLLEAVGVDQVITMEAHNLAALQNGFRCPLVHLESHTAFARHLAGRLEGQPVTVVSPDLGAAKRAESFREALEACIGRPVEKAFMEKKRSMGRVTGELFAGDVAGRTAVIFDDMISSGTTMMRAARACRERGAVQVHLVAAHGLFSADAPAVLSELPLDGIHVANTVAARLEVPGVQIVDMSANFADALRRSTGRPQSTDGREGQEHPPSP